VQAACINPLEKPPRAERILVIRLGAMGDVVRTLPAFAELRARYPSAHVTWLVEPKAEGALRGQPGIDEVIIFPRDALEVQLGERRWLHFIRDSLRFARLLRRRRFDLVLDFHAILKTGLLALATGAPLRVGYAPPFVRELSLGLANRRARIEPTRVSRFVRNAALIDFLAIAPEVVPRAEAGHGASFAIDKARLGQMRDLLAEQTQGADSVAVIHPGSSGGASYKRYPVGAWAEVAVGLVSLGAACVVSAGNDEEREIARQVVARSGGAASLAPATPTLADLAALLAACRLFLGSDSGPLHVASLSGTPVVQVLGPTDPIENRPWAGTPFRSVRVPVGCSPCRSGCAAATCMRVLPPEAVLAAAQELLAEPALVAGATASA
jgi:heptosyltransferase-1